MINSAKNIIFSQALGDAIGLATEFMKKTEVNEKYQDIQNFTFDTIVQDYHRSNWKRGDWTDDTDIMIIRYQLLKKNKLNPINYARALIKWIDNGFPACGDDKCHGLGNTFAIWQGDKYALSDPVYAGFRAWVYNPFRPMMMSSNGSLMASGILGIIEDDMIRREKTIEINRITHTDPNPILACLFQTELISRIIKKKNYMDFDNIINDIKPSFISYCNELKLMIHDFKLKECSDEMDEIIKENINNFLQNNTIEPDRYILELKNYLNYERIEDLKLDENIGYCYKAIGCIAIVLRNINQGYLPNIINIIKEGGDADTNAAIVGSTVGCIYGYNALPVNLVNSLFYKEFLDNIVRK